MLVRMWKIKEYLQTVHRNVNPGNIAVESGGPSKRLK
jgi:hypothetical protein